MKFLPLAAIMVALAAPITVSAATFMTAEKINPEKTITDDLYAAGDTVLLDQVVEGDVFIAGFDVDITGGVDGDIFTVGKTIRISGEVTDDILSAGNSIEIDTPVADDLFAAAATITLSPETTITGDAHLVGGRVVLSGTINGTVWVASSDVEVTEGTTITGDLISYGSQEPFISNEAKIAGETRHVPQQRQDDTAKTDLLGWVQQVLATFAGAAVLLYAFPASSRRIIAQAVTKPTISLGLGAAHILLFIPVSLALLISLVGMSLGFLTLAVTAATIIAGVLYAALLIGERIMTWVTKNQS